MHASVGYYSVFLQRTCANGLGDLSLVPLLKRPSSRLRFTQHRTECPGWRRPHPQLLYRSSSRAARTSERSSPAHSWQPLNAVRKRELDAQVNAMLSPSKCCVKDVRLLLRLVLLSIGLRARRADHGYVAHLPRSVEVPSGWNRAGVEFCCSTLLYIPIHGTLSCECTLAGSSR